ncbi:protein Abitram [Hyalella azteca]|uniref:Protein Abitram n=1 Tax=Hyalella azteca TaxID=294128 RepID=A0A8B7PCZ3_HYAAZ|nr:protein Abitram [Hyalella azteca]
MSLNTRVPPIEDSVPLDACYPSVSERYYMHYYYIPKKQMIRDNTNHNSSIPLNSRITDADSQDGPCKKIRLDTPLPEPGSRSSTVNHQDANPNNQSTFPINKDGSYGADLRDNCVITGEETLVMVHSNRLCVVSLSPHHPIVQGNLTVNKVSFEVDGVDRLSNQVSGKGKRGAQVLGSKATLCKVHTDDGRIYHVMCGARGKLVQVNERLVSEPELCGRSAGADGWLAVVLPNLTIYDGLIMALTPAERYTELWQRQMLKNVDRVKC